MLLLFETPAGFALFQVLNEKKLDKVEDIGKLFETTESTNKIVQLKAFDKFENTADALASAAALVESKLSKGLKKFLKAECQGETLAIADSKLGSIIKEKIGINCVHTGAVIELMRGVRSQLGELITGLAGKDMAPMSLGLSHSLSRYKLKFSPDKVDTMIVQAIGLLDDLDKELNTYAMRVREWYGWHFPELAKIIQDNIQYAKTVKFMGERVNAADMDFSGILDEEVESDMKEAAVISMGTEVSEHDMRNIKSLCDQVIGLSEYRAQLYDYLKSRMTAIAPNLTVLVGELVGARLIAHTGSLINLAKQPASTVQILGAEKALFRALKTKHATPKYGLIYHASLIGQAAPKHKGKISRVLAAKCALSIRVDALGEDSQGSLGFDSRLKVEARLRQLEGKTLGKLSEVTKGKSMIEAYDKDRKKDTPAIITAAKVYNTANDSTMAVKEEREKKEKKEKKKVKVEEEEEEEERKEENEEEEEEKPKTKKPKVKKEVEGKGGEEGEKEREKSKEKKKKAKEDVGKVEEEKETEKPKKKKKRETKANAEVEAEKEEEEEKVEKKEKKKGKRKNEEVVEEKQEPKEDGKKKKKKKKSDE